MDKLPIDWTLIQWDKVGALAVIAFVAALLANLLTMGNKFFGAILTGILFAVLYVAWFGWLQNLVGVRFPA